MEFSCNVTHLTSFWNKKSKVAYFHLKWIYTSLLCLLYLWSTHFYHFGTIFSLWSIYQYVQYISMNKAVMQIDNKFIINKKAAYKLQMRETTSTIIIQEYFWLYMFFITDWCLTSILAQTFSSEIISLRLLTKILNM